MSLKLNRDGPDLKSSSSSSLQNMADAAMEVACENPLGNIIEKIDPENSNRLLAKPFVEQITPMINLQYQMAMPRTPRQLRAIMAILRWSDKYCLYDIELALGIPGRSISFRFRQGKTSQICYRKHRSGQVGIYKWLRLKDIDFGVKG
ncbi:hypothetical protein BASA61_008500 [Batrachochytrium salamandrivorans]|nr:hypothetical protein BASA61_008500 [Batrachochytrium salamandrivorans]